MRAMFRPAWDRLVLPYWWYGVAIKIPIIKRGNKQHQHLLRKKKGKICPFSNQQTYEELQKTYKQVWKKEVRKVLLLKKSTVHFIKQVSVPSLKFTTPKKPPRFKDQRNFELFQFFPSGAPGTCRRTVVEIDSWNWNLFFIQWRYNCQAVHT